MSKKLAEGLQALVLDVKWGSGAFMKDVAQASELAAVMAGIGRSMGVPTTALVTDMNQPLGRKAGNALEVEEAVQTLQGQGPEDLVEVTLALACELLTATGVERDAPAAERRLRQLLASGTAYEQFARMVRAQEGDLAAPRPLAPRYELPSATAGYVGAIDGEELGWALIEMGAGRRHKEDPLDLSTGLEMHVRRGDRVDVGQPLATLYVASDGPRPCAAALPLRMVADAIRVVDEPPAQLPLVVRRVDGRDFEEGLAL